MSEVGEGGRWKAVLTEGPTGRTLLRLTVPMVAGILGMVAFNLTDTFFVSRYHCWLPLVMRNF